MERLREAGVPDPRREAEFLLGFVLGTDRGGVLVRRPEPIDAASADRFEALLTRRAAREPFQYLTGEQEFLGRGFAVDARVLVPRPETEEVVEALLERLDPGARGVADLGTGSGCIAVSVALARPGVRVHALDRSEGALDVARANAVRHGVHDRITFRLGDFAEPPREWLAGMDAVISNPPYVGEDEWRDLAPEVRDHEPKAALVPGPTGDEAYRVVAAAASALLVPGGLLVAELGHRSAAGAAAAARAFGLLAVEVIVDRRGIDRILVARRP